MAATTNPLPVRRSRSTALACRRILPLKTFNHTSTEYGCIFHSCLQAADRVLTERNDKHQMLHLVAGMTSFCWALIAVFLHMQFGPIDSTVILIEKGGTGLSRGCAFVNFSTYEAAMASIAALDNQVILPGGPYNLRVSHIRTTAYPFTVIMPATLSGWCIPRLHSVMSTVTIDIVQVRFANRPGTDSRRPLAAGPASTLSEVDRRRVFFTRGPPGVVKDTIEAAFLPYGEVGPCSLRTRITCSMVPHLQQICRPPVQVTAALCHRALRGHCWKKCTTSCPKCMLCMCRSRRRTCSRTRRLVPPRAAAL
jgi:uncharacterized membrane protein